MKDTRRIIEGLRHDRRYMTTKLDVLSPYCSEQVRARREDRGDGKEPVLSAKGSRLAKGEQLECVGV